MREILVGSVLALMLVGCGGGSATDTGDNVGSSSSSDPISGDNTGNNVITTGTSFYIDSAVSGINYTCGTKQGITGVDGSFTFDVGSGCTFYLGDVTLRTVDAGVLRDGQSVYETDLNIARILQSLDADGNPDNGIQINAEIVKALAGQTLPTTSEQLEAFLQTIAAEGGTVVSEADASNHLKETKIRAALAGKTLYYAEYEYGDFGGELGDIFYISDTFNNAMTAVLGEDFDGSTVVNNIINITGNIIYYESYYEEILEITDKYVILRFYQNERLDEALKFYFNKMDAISNPNPFSPFT